jgi:hypothetical protein
MDKKVIFAVAGSGKTTYIVNNLSSEKRSLIVTYTTGNLSNLHKKITDKFDGKWPNNITLMSYFSFINSFCYKPFLADKYNANGIVYFQNPSKFAKKDNLNFYMTDNGYYYSNRLAFFLQGNKIMNDIKGRIKKYFDEFIIDEVQDISGRDFNFLEDLMKTDINMLFVGDFYQHTFDTSRDGTVNNSLFKDKTHYEQRFVNCGFYIDNSTLKNSWRCSRTVCNYISENLSISISSNRDEPDDTTVSYIEQSDKIDEILTDLAITKLHYQNGSKYGAGHRNWGDSKGEDHHKDICILLNKTTADLYRNNKLSDMAVSTRNKLYVAISRARGDVYLIDE